MAKNKIQDLRDHLFETLEALKDKDEPMDVARARAVAEVSRQIIDSAKVEVAFLSVTGGLKTSGFLPMDDEVGAQRLRLTSKRSQRR